MSNKQVCKWTGGTCPDFEWCSGVGFCLKHVPLPRLEVKASPIPLIQLPFDSKHVEYVRSEEIKRKKGPCLGFLKNREKCSSLEYEPGSLYCPLHEDQKEAIRGMLINPADYPKFQKIENWRRNIQHCFVIMLSIYGMNSNSILDFFVACFQAFQEIGPEVNCPEYYCLAWIFLGGKVWLPNDSKIPEEKLDLTKTFLKWLPTAIEKSTLELDKPKCLARARDLTPQIVGGAIRQLVNMSW
jgi:hypothetical protein